MVINSDTNKTMHAEHQRLSNCLNSSLKDEIKRGLSLIDSCVNQIAQAKWILINIDKTISESGKVKTCPVCSSNSKAGSTSGGKSESDVRAEINEQVDNYENNNDFGVEVAGDEEEEFSVSSRGGRRSSSGRAKKSSLKKLAAESVKIEKTTRRTPAAAKNKKIKFNIEEPKKRNTSKRTPSSRAVPRFINKYKDVMDKYNIKIKIRNINPWMTSIQENYSYLNTEDKDEDADKENVKFQKTHFYGFELDDLETDETVFLNSIQTENENFNHNFKKFSPPKESGKRKTTTSSYSSSYEEKDIFAKFDESYKNDNDDGPSYMNDDDKHSNASSGSLFKGEDNKKGRKKIQKKVVIEEEEEEEEEEGDQKLTMFEKLMKKMKTKLNYKNDENDESSSQNDKENSKDAEDGDENKEVDFKEKLRETFAKFRTNSSAATTESGGLGLRKKKSDSSLNDIDDLINDDKITSTKKGYGDDDEDMDEDSSAMKEQQIDVIMEIETAGLSPPPL